MTRGERGVGTVLTLGLSLALIVLTGASAVLVGWFAAIRHAEQAAELAALAGSSAALAGADPCDAVEKTARENDASAQHCIVRGNVPDVVVEVGIIVALEPRVPGAPEKVVRFATAGVA